MPKDRQCKYPPEAPSPGEHLGVLIHAFASFKVMAQSKPVSRSRHRGAINPVSHQLGSHLWHCLTTSPWAACVDVLQMCQPGTSATGPSWHSMAEVGRDLWRFFCPTPWLGVSNSRALRAVSHWVLNVYCQCRVLDKHTRGATTAAALCTVLDIVSSAAVVKK